MMHTMYLAPICIALVALGVGCSSDGGDGPGPTNDGGSTVNGDGTGPTGDGGGPTGDGAGPAGDAAVTLGTQCSIVSNQVVHTAPGGAAIWFPRIAWDGAQLGLNWTEERESMKYDVKAARLDTSGKLIGSVITVSGSNTASAIEPTGFVGLSGGGFASAWSDTRAGAGARDIYCRRFGPDGNLFAEKQVTSSTTASYPDLSVTGTIAIGPASHAEALALIWRDGRSGAGGPHNGGSGRHDLYVKLIDRTGTELSPEKLITNDPAHEAAIYPRIAWDGANFLAAWQDDTFTATELYWTRISPAGDLLGGIQFLSSGTGLPSGRPDVTWGGSEFGVTFSAGPDKDHSEVKLVRISPFGQPSAKHVVTSAIKPCTPGIGATRGRFAVAFQDNCSETGSRMKFALLDDKGHPLQADGTACTDPANGSCGQLDLTPDPQGVPANPQLVGVEDTFYVTWMTGATSSIHLARITCSP